MASSQRAIPMSIPVKSVLAFFDVVMAVLGIIFIGLLVVQFAATLTPEEQRAVTAATTAIWAAFVFDFVIRFLLADSKRRFLREYWYLGIALLVPPIGPFQSVQLVRVFQIGQLLVGLGRGAHTLRRAFREHGGVYVALLTTAVVILSSAAMYSFEQGAPGATVSTFGEALWWAAATTTTVGSEDYPVTDSGRMLAVLVMLYSVVFAGYVTAALAVVLLLPSNAPAAPAIPGPAPAAC
jgi:voltage-gated potassium channel